jgi:hypothetical protein
MNDAQLAEKKERNARRGLTPMAIGLQHVPAGIAASFAYIKVA